MKILVLNGANINMLGIREPSVYGTATYDDLKKYLICTASELGVEIDVWQSNHEGEIIDKLQSAIGAYDGIVVNPGGYSHYSVSIADALRATNLPRIEVHLTDIYSREPYRRVTVTGDACDKIIAGKGFAGYKQAIKDLIKMI